MSDKETIAKFRASLEAYIPQTLADIAEVEQSTAFSPEYKKIQVARLREYLAIREQDIIGFDNLIDAIKKSYSHPA